MLGALYLRGNPAVSAIRSYRKSLIAALPALSYLDDRPIFEVERLCAEAWCASIDSCRPSIDLGVAYKSTHQSQRANDDAPIQLQYGM